MSRTKRKPIAKLLSASFHYNNAEKSRAPGYLAEQFALLRIKQAEEAAKPKSVVTALKGRK